MPRHTILLLLIPFVIAPVYACEPDNSYTTQNPAELIFSYVNEIKTEQLQTILENNPRLDEYVNSGHLERAVYRYLCSLHHEKNTFWIEKCRTMIFLLIEHGANPCPKEFNGQDSLKLARNGYEDYTENFYLPGCSKLAHEIECLWTKKQSRNN